MTAGIIISQKQQIYVMRARLSLFTNVERIYAGLSCFFTRRVALRRARIFYVNRLITILAIIVIQNVNGDRRVQPLEFWNVGNFEWEFETLVI